MTCVTILWKFEDTAPVHAGRIQRSCLCGWDTDTSTDTPANRSRLARRGVEHVAGKEAAS